MVSKAIGDAERRGRNVIINGVPEDSSASPDERQFLTNMFHDDLHFDLSCRVLSSRRLGAPSHNHRYQRLMATLDTNVAASDVLTRSKQLRQSSNAYVAASVFRNKDMTADESKQAYERRERRRHGTIGLVVNTDINLVNDFNLNPASQTFIPAHVGARNSWTFWRSTAPSNGAIYYRHGSY